ncbi:alkaline phosphatase family protein [Paractinoplanes ferrugineus]|uniref:Acid phosphatase n=2 Tax=Paractinoplanes ferrugineus TaxID=113564 RepID=A0A919J9E3_9ACTN|nr:acid phosphatase [Actinoplanes ferrugineus]
MLLGSVTAAAHPMRARPTAALGAVNKPDHVVIVVLENKRYDAVIGHRKAPWVNELAEGGANLTRFYAETHPSQPNYLALFSGSTHGVRDNKCPHNLGARPNLGRQLIDAGYSFTGYSEDLPRVGWRGCSHSGYVRRHVPWVNFSNVPASAHQPYTAFPRDYRKLPTVAFVIPNLCHDMHDCPKAEADAWLRKEFARYVAWAKTHNSLFVLTFDEDNQTDGNHIPTVVAGAGIKPSRYVARANHYGLLRTLQDMYGLRPTGLSAGAAPMRGVGMGR